MAATMTFLSTTNLTKPSLNNILGPRKHNSSRQLSLSSCKACNNSNNNNNNEPSLPKWTPLNMTKRGLVTEIVLSLGVGGGGYVANAAVLEADDDVELLEKVKRDRKKRLERQGVISSSTKEAGYLQDVVYQLSKVGQAIDNNDLSTASSVLRGSTDADWVRKANIAFSKLSSSVEEQTEVDTFNSSIASLTSSVSSNDIESSKTAFVSSAMAFEKWTTLTGLVGQLKGL